MSQTITTYEGLELLCKKGANYRDKSKYPYTEQT